MRVEGGSTSRCTIYIYTIRVYIVLCMCTILYIYIYDIYTYKYIYLHMHMQFTIYYMCMYIVIEYQIFNSWGPLDILLHGVLNGKFLAWNPTEWWCWCGKCKDPHDMYKHVRIYLYGSNLGFQTLPRLVPNVEHIYGLQGLKCLINPSRRIGVRMVPYLFH